MVREIEGFGVRAYAHEADVSQEDQVVDMVSRMVDELGTIDVPLRRRRHDTLPGLRHRRMTPGAFTGG